MFSLSLSIAHYVELLASLTPLIPSSALCFATLAPLAHSVFGLAHSVCPLPCGWVEKKYVISLLTRFTFWVGFLNDDQYLFFSESLDRICAGRMAMLSIALAGYLKGKFGSKLKLKFPPPSNHTQQAAIWQQIRHAEVGIWLKDPQGNTIVKYIEEILRPLKLISVAMR